MIDVVPGVATGTATFLFTDVEGSTRLLKQLREGYAQVLAEHQRLLREAFAAHDGEEIDTQGDSFFVAFRRAKDAVLAAATAQRALAEQARVGGGGLRVRMGIHTGEVTVADDRYIGLSVHRAARICAAGHGGQVLVSQTTANVLEDEEEDLPGIELRDLGEQRLKDLDRPVRIYQVDIEGLPSDFPPLEAADAPFAGREAELEQAASTALGGRRLSRRWLLAGGLGVVALAAAATAVLLLRGGEPAAVTVVPNSLVKIDPATNRPTAVIEVGDEPDFVVTAGRYAWVAHGLRRTTGSPPPVRGEGLLSRVDLETNDTAVVGGGFAPCGMAADPSGDLWVANCTGTAVQPTARIVRVDAETLEFRKVLHAAPTHPGLLRGLAYGGGSLWIGNPDEGDSGAQTVSRLNPRTGTGRSIRVGSWPSGMAWADRYLWVTNLNDGSLSGIQASTNVVQTVDRVADNAIAVALLGRVAWIADFLEPVVTRVDVVDLRPDGSVSLPVRHHSGVWWVASGEGSIWAATPNDGALWRIDPTTNRPTRIPLGFRPTGVAVGGGAVWVTVDDVD